MIEVSADPELPESRVELEDVVVSQLHRLLLAAPGLPETVVVADDRKLFVELFPGLIPGTDDVALRAEVRVNGELVAQTETESCMSCTNEQVGEKLFAMLCPQDEVGGRNYALFASLPPPPAAAEPEPVEEAQPEAQPAAQTEARRAAGPLLIGGAGLLAVGVAGLGAGVALIVVDERIVAGDDLQELEVVKYKDPGIAVALVGGAAAIAGAAMLGVALQRRKRSESQAALSVAPVVSGNSYGVWLSGRF